MSTADKKQTSREKRVKQPATDKPDFILEDVDGEKHEYHVTPHDPTEATPMLVKLTSIAKGPIASLLDSNAGTVVKLATGEKDALDQDVDDFIEELEFSGFLDDIYESLVEANAPQLIQDILSETTRDGIPLRDPDNYNDAYRQNYAEMMQAVWMVIRVNGFLGSRGMPGND
ncbi:MAG: phage tail assembly chaperone [Bradymonadaceae bacterium]